MWIASVKIADDEWSDSQEFATVEQVTGWMWHTANFLVPDYEDVLIKGGNPEVHFRVKWVPNK